MSVHHIGMIPYVYLIGAYPINVDVTAIYFKGVHLLVVHLWAYLPYGREPLGSKLLL